MNTLQHTTELALHLCNAYIDKESIAVDCTCGNGHDTLWLAKRCKKVYAFDIQKQAIEATAKLLAENALDNVELIKDSHENIKKYVKEEPCVIVFNLGFLPGGDKGLTTKRASSLAAIKEALEVLAVGGVLSITMYPGHKEGKYEQDLILEWAKNLSSREYHAVFANMLNQSNKAPQVLWITKKK
ncbi:MAG: class I SAM-dependent methyltransferase [Firmicutes bacterium]|nr:class I SAM-dependent methyltransferase [Bacillota bacterium]